MGQLHHQSAEAASLAGYFGREIAKGTVKSIWDLEELPGVEKVTEEYNESRRWVENWTYIYKIEQLGYYIHVAVTLDLASTENTEGTEREPSEWYISLVEPHEVKTIEWRRP